MKTLNKLVYDIYRNIVDVTKEIEISKEDHIQDEGLFIIIRNLLKQIYRVSYAAPLMNVWMRIDDIKDYLTGEASEEDIEPIIKCLTDCKKYIEAYLTKGRKILIYSETPGDFEDIIKSFEWEGYNILSRFENMNVLEQIEFEYPDLIIIDNNSRTNNGMTLYKLILNQELMPARPVIFTGDAYSDAKINALLMGAVDYVEKPFNIVEFFTQVKNILAFSDGGHNEEYLENIYPRIFGEAMVKAKLKKVNETRGSMHIIKIDMDNMAEINIRKGKSRGSEILKRCLDSFFSNLDKSDSLYRASLDEFIVVCIDKDISEVFNIAKSMQHGIIEISKEYGVHLSFTAGIVSCNDFKDYHEALQYTERCLREVKRTGKGTIHIFSTLGDNAGGERILIIDNDRVILNILESRYRSRGYEVLGTDKVEEAKNIISEGKINVIVTEFLMPGLSGRELIEELKRYDRAVRIIVLTAKRTEEFISSAFGAGADDYVIKPFSPIDLDYRIERFLK